MDTDKCNALLTVLKTGSLSVAAEQLGYTPSGISRLITSMEQESGFALIVRSRKGIIPTPECEKLIPTFQELQYFGAKYNELIAKIKGIEIGEINIGISYRTYYPWLMQLISSFLIRYPNIKINLTEGSSSELLEEMRQRQLDFCIISKREGNFKWIPLQDNPLVAWLPINHPYAASENVPIQLFETDPYIDTYPNQETDNARMLKQNNIKPNTRFTTTDNYATYCMVEAGLGISLNNGLNSYGWDGKVVIKPIFPSQTISLGIASPTIDNLSQASKQFVSYIKAQAIAVQNHL